MSAGRSACDLALDERSQRRDRGGREGPAQDAAQPAVVGRVEPDERLRRQHEQLAHVRVLGGELRDPRVVLGRARAVEAVRAPGRRVEHHGARGRRVGDHPAAGCGLDAQWSSSVWAALRACLAALGDCSIAAVAIAPSKRK